jgi:hypothetical protein
MTSSRKKHHPAGGPAPAASTPTPARSTSTRTWVIRVLAVLGVAAGATMALIGASPDSVGGWGKLLLIVPGICADRPQRGSSTRRAVSNKRGERSS